METVRAGERLVERDGVTVTVLGADGGLEEAIVLLDQAESQVGAPLVDEAERSRLHDREDASADGPAHWHPLLAAVGGTATGYAGVVVPASGGVAEADLAPDRLRAGWEDTVTALLDGLVAVANRHGAGSLRVWVRHATDADECCAASEGFQVDRALSVLGRGSDAVDDPRMPDGIRVRPFVPERDEDGVVAVLREAYEGTPDGGWDHERFEERRAYGWFDPRDLLVAADDDGVAGLHWTKRRGDGVGEVYNLAVADRARGLGLGRALLRSGLRHLAERGCDEVILWVDRDNDTAVDLYRSEGFTDLWADIAFRRRLG